MTSPITARGGLTAGDEKAIRRWRLDRIRAELRKKDYAGAVFADAINLRYATGTRNMQVWTLRNPARYAFVATEGPVVMFEFAGCDHLVRHIEVIDELRVATGVFYFTAGPRLADRARKWAGELADLVMTHGGGNRRLAVDRLGPEQAAALGELGVEVVDGSAIAERARAIKSPEEVAGLAAALRVCEAGLVRVRQSLRPGISENALWAGLHEVNIAEGGEYIETRLLTSGPRTNPWFQEATDRPIAAGELVALDTDLIGPGGFFADMSRTFLCGDGRPTGAQRDLYQLAHEQIQTNMAMLRPGASFREISEKSWAMPARFRKHRYMSLVHGAGLCGEYPYIPYPEDFAVKGYDGEIEQDMTLCVESFIGDEHGGEGVKLEELVHVGPDGARPLTRFPFEETLLR